MQAIETKYLCATNSNGARIKATCARGSIIVSWDHGLNAPENYIAAAKALVAKFVEQDAKGDNSTPPEKNPWNRPFATGCLKNGNYVHVFTEATC